MFARARGIGVTADLAGANYGCESGSARMLHSLGARMLWTKKGGTVHNWMIFGNWTWMTVAMVAWIGLIAAVGYVAALAAWHGTET